jgi:hypothetical protein
MAELRMTLETISQLDGGAAGAIINAAIADAVRDIDDRGEDGKPRIVEIRLNLTKRPNGQVEVDVEAAAKAPRRRTASTVCNIRTTPASKDSSLLFQAYSPSDPDQRTIDELE